MASLLGSKFCIESLRVDVTDLQSSVVDVLSRCGPIDAPSWKYPDRRAADLDLPQILETYDYSEDEEERQLSHVVLLELVIDRFILLLQSLSKHNESLSGGKANDSGTSHTSIGLVVKSYWKRMLETHQAVQELTTENKAMKSKNAELAAEAQQMGEEVARLKETIANMEDAARSLGSGAGLLTPFPLNDKDAAVARALTSASNYSISRDEYNKCTQTVETAFVPCESCEAVQKDLRLVGDFTAKVCADQGLPSSLAKFRTLIEGLDWFTANDVARWTAEVGKDMSRISKHLQGLEASINPLQKDLAESIKQRKKLEKALADAQDEMKLERETSTTERKQFIAKLDDVKRDSESKILSVEKEKELLTKGKKQLQQQMNTIKVKMAEQQEILEQLEEEKHNLESDLKQNYTSQTQVRELESETSVLSEKIEDLKEQLNKSDQELAMEKARVKSMEMQNAAVQSKQEALIGRLEELSNESEGLREKIADMEEEKEALEEQLEHAHEHRAQLEKKHEEEQLILETLKSEVESNLEAEQVVVRELTSEKERLEQCMEELREEMGGLETTLKETQEKLQFLAEYPDQSNAPVLDRDEEDRDTVGAMNRQIHANSLRIQVLEEQNSKYRRVVTRMMDVHKGAAQLMSKPVTLWSTIPSTADSHQPSPSTLSGAHQQQQQQDSEAYNGSHPREHDHKYSIPHDPPMRTSSLPPKPPAKQSIPKQRTSLNQQPGQRGSVNQAQSHQRGSGANQFLPRPQDSSQPQSVSSQNVQFDFVVGKGPAPSRPRSSSGANKSPTKHRQSSASGKLPLPQVGSESRPNSATSSMAAYSKLKNSGLMRNSGWGSSAGPGGKGQEFQCTTCQRGYDNAKDLEIHQMYCY